MNQKIKTSNLSPGTLVFTGNKKVDRVKISLLEYDEKSYTEKEITQFTDLKLRRDTPCVSWINITGLHEIDFIQKIGDIFKIHPLLLEDVLNVQHNPKIDNYEDYLFVIAKMIDLNEISGLNIEQVSFILGDSYLITFQEDEEDVFDIIRERIRNNVGRIRKNDADYLMYRLLDAIVDNYYNIVSNLEERIDKIEDKILSNPNKVSLNSIHTFRKEVNKFRRSVLPLYEVIAGLDKDRDKRINKTTTYFLRDLKDHLKHIIDNIENFREVSINIIDMHLSTSSNKMNEVMKLLTMISTIFIPLTFIVGIYGMNFNTSVSSWNMPELNSPYGYPAIMLIMMVIGILLVIYFKRKEWF